METDAACTSSCSCCHRYGPLMAKQVRLTLTKAIAKANLRCAGAGNTCSVINALAVQAAAAPTTVARLSRTDEGRR